MAEPWMLDYSDGSSNHTRIWQEGEAVRYEYTPTTPQHSSSGTYSGGRPTRGLVPEAFVVELWGRIQAMATDTSQHTRVRIMGSGAFTIAIDDDAQHFQVRRCASLRDFDAWLRATLNLGRG